MDDRFEELLADLPDPDGGDVERIDTWRRPVRFIAWGILLTTVIFNFLYLDRLLPPVGAVLTVLGFRALRRLPGGLGPVAPAACADVRRPSPADFAVFLR